MTGKHAILSAVAASVLLAAPASAQGSSGFSLGVGGGFAQAAEGIGYTILSTLEFPSPFRVVRPRADVFFANWAGAPHVTGVTGNVLLIPFSNKRAEPYLLVGGGMYVEEGAKPKTGGTLGLGLRLPGALRTVVIESQVQLYLLNERRGPWDAPPGAVIEPSQYRRKRDIWKPIGITIQF
jgi:hypothetical protein